jgi:dihydrofolate reductase
MKIFCIAAITADGFIARDDRQAAMWTSKADKTFFREMTKKAGVIVMGSKTFETIGSALPDRRNIILSRTKTYDVAGVETSSESPTDLVARLEKEGVKELAICGGSAIYTAFLKAGLVSTLYITVESLLFGSGVTLFNENLDMKIALKEARPIGDGAVVLQYDVIQ